MFLCQPLDTCDLGAPQPTAVDESDRIKPELGNVGIPFNVDVWWFIAVTCVEEKTIRAGS